MDHNLDSAFSPDQHLLRYTGNLAWYCSGNDLHCQRMGGGGVRVNFYFETHPNVS